ncbi:MAG: DUF3577 domain-containing protein [Gammaproteobacteria bacterium]
MSDNETTSQASKFFDLMTNGLGYVSRLRDVQPVNGDPFVSVSIAALRGAADQVKYTHFDCVLAGDKVRQVVAKLKPFIDGNRKVLIGFTLSDLRAESFTFKKGERAGNTGISLKARLVRIPWAKVDGNAVHDERQAA